MGFFSSPLPLLALLLSCFSASAWVTKTVTVRSETQEKVGIFYVDKGQWRHGVVPRLVKKDFPVRVQREGESLACIVFVPGSTQFLYKELLTLFGDESKNGSCVLEVSQDELGLKYPDKARTTYTWDTNFTLEQLCQILGFNERKVKQDMA